MFCESCKAKMHDELIAALQTPWTLVGPRAGQPGERCTAVRDVSGIRYTQDFIRTDEGRLQSVPNTLTSTRAEES